MQVAGSKPLGPLLTKLTVPPGADAPAPAVSDTVAKQVPDCPTATEPGVQVTVVDVERAETVICVLAPVSTACVVSPL
jgi:hypothetical protein